MKHAFSFLRKTIALFCILGCLSTHAQLDQTFFKKLQNERVQSSDLVTWQQFGPGMSGYCEAYWCHPTDPNVMFMSPDMYNSYGTWDGGKSWQTIKDYDGNGRDMRRVQHIVFSIQNPKFGMAIDVAGKLYKTQDQGHSWQMDTNFPDSKKYMTLTVDPTNDNIWYMGAGDFWNVKANHRSKESPLGVQYKYAVYGQILKSTDKGKTWNAKKNGLPETLDVGRIIVDPINSKTLIMAANSGIYKSTDQGETWTLSGKGLPNNAPRDLDFYFDKKTNEFILYCIDQTSFKADGQSITSTGGLFKSLDHGNTWQNISGNVAVDLNQITNPSVINKYWKSVAFWLGISEKELKTAHPKLPTEIMDVYNRLKVNPTNKNEIYLSHNVKHDKAFAPGDVWKTEDGGKSWFVTARAGKYWNAEKDKAYWESRKTPTKANTEFAHLQADVDVTDENWGNRFLEINPKGEVFICLEQQILRSNDKGKSWTQVDDNETDEGSQNWVGRGGSNLPGRFMLLQTGVKDRYLFCSGEHGLWQTALLGNYPDKKAIAVTQLDGQVNEGATSIATVAVHPKDPNIIYTLMFRQKDRGGLRRSTDGGKTWKKIATPLVYGGNLSEDHIFQYSLQIDPIQPDNMYFCVMENAITEVSSNRRPKDFEPTGVYKSSDGGFTWSPQNAGFPAEYSVNRISLDPNNPNTIYAALNTTSKGKNGGLFKSTNNANTWEQVAIPSDIKSVNNVFIDKKTRAIFISCGSKTGEDNEGGVYKSTDEGNTWNKIFDMPYIWQTETSPLDPNIITVVAAGRAPIPKITNYNPGAYLSLDGGKTWNKTNTNLGQPDMITDFKPDPNIKGIYWCAQWGSGWTIGYTKDINKGWYELMESKKQ